MERRHEIVCYLEVMASVHDCVALLCIPDDEQAPSSSYSHSGWTPEYLSSQKVLSVLF